MRYEHTYGREGALFWSSGLAPKSEDGDSLKKEKGALRYVCEKMMNSNLNRIDTAVIIKNFKYQRSGI